MYCCSAGYILYVRLQCVLHGWLLSGTQTSGYLGFEEREVSNVQVWEYGRELHCATLMKESCKRVLIRLTGTDSVIKY